MEQVVSLTTGGARHGGPDSGMGAGAWRQCHRCTVRKESRERLTGDPTVRKLNISPFIFPDFKNSRF